MSAPRLAVIGAGKLGETLITGLVDAGTLAPADIRITTAHPERTESLAARLGVRGFSTNAEAARGADIVLVCVKPHQVAPVLADLKDVLTPAQLLISVAASASTAYIEQRLSGDIPVVRAMPNTPALIGAGATGLFATPHVTPAQRAATESLLAATGIVAWIADEALMDAVTAVSGSGPAYFFLLVEALQAAAEAQGLPRDAARALVVQTALGAARMAAEGGEDAATLRQRVTSPGGTTQSAIEALEAGGFRRLVADAVARATARGAELSRQFGD